MELEAIYHTLYSAGVTLGVADKEELAQTILCRALNTRKPLEGHNKNYWLVAARNYAKSEWRMRYTRPTCASVEFMLEVGLEAVAIDDPVVDALILDILSQISQRVFAIVEGYAPSTPANRVYLCRQRKRLRAEWAA